MCVRVRLPWWCDPSMTASGVMRIGVLAWANIRAPWMPQMVHHHPKCPSSQVHGHQGVKSCGFPIDHLWMVKNPKSCTIPLKDFERFWGTPMTWENSKILKQTQDAHDVGVNAHTRPSDSPQMGEATERDQEPLGSGVQSLVL